MIFEEASGPGRAKSSSEVTENRCNSTADRFGLIEAMGNSTVRVVPVSNFVLAEGYYVARKHKWLPDASFTIVMVIASLDDGGPLEVHEHGRPRFTHPREWLFRDRILGLKEASADYHRAFVERSLGAAR